MGIEQDQLTVDPSVLFQHLVCAVCQDGYERPRALPCGHNFCEDCIFLWVRRLVGEVKTCPLCRQAFVTRQITEVSPLLEGVMDSLRWRCQYEGCYAVMPLAERQRHRLHCAFRLMQCPRLNCNRRIRRQDLAMMVASRQLTNHPCRVHIRRRANSRDASGKQGIPRKLIGP